MHWTDMLDWDQLQTRYDEISQQLLVPDIDQNERQSLQQEASRLAQLLELHRKLDEVVRQHQGAHEQIHAVIDDELVKMFQEEIDQLQVQQNELESELDQLLYPPDPLDNRSAFLEIRAGTGGQEASLFAADLMKMYTNYAIKRHWKVSVVDISETDLGGIREVALHIQGKHVYGCLKREIGVHRVQRVPQTETQGRVHTSTATVAVFPEAKEVDVQVNPSDLRIDTYRAGGAGGQHVNRTDSAVRITHIPTGTVVACQDERSQHKNKAKALKLLQSRILVAERERQAEISREQRKEMVGSGMRAEKVRTYNFPQNRVTDHQANLTLKNLDMVIEGELDDIVEALVKYDREERKKRAKIS